MCITASTWNLRPANLPIPDGCRSGTTQSRAPRSSNSRSGPRSSWARARDSAAAGTGPLETDIVAAGLSPAIEQLAGSPSIATWRLRRGHRGGLLPQRGRGACCKQPAMLALDAKGVPGLTLYEKTAIMDPCEKTPNTSAAPAVSVAVACPTVLVGVH